MSRMGGVLSQQLLQRRVNRSIPAVMTNLENAFSVVCHIEQFFRFFSSDRKQLFAKDVLPSLDSRDGDLAVSSVRSANQNSVAIIQKLFSRRADLAADAPRRPFCAFRDNVVQRSDLSPLIARIDPTMNVADIARSDNSNS